MKRTKTRKKVLPSLGQNLSEDGVDIKKELQELDDRSDLNKDNVIEMMSKILSVMNSPDVNYQHHNVIDLGLHGCTLLHVAAAFNYARIADFLIQAGADVNSQDRDMRTPLHYALENNYLKIAKFLIANGASINTREALQALNDRPGLNKDTVTKMMCECIPHLVKDSPDVNYPRHKIMYYDGFKPILIHCTLLHMAARYNCPRLAGCLIERGADVDSQDARGRTPLQIALENDYLETAKLLIDEGADQSCVPAYITKISNLKGEATAVMMVIIATAVTPIVLAESTELSALAIIGATIASMLIAGSIAFGLAYMWSKYELSSMLNEVKHDNSLSQHQAKKI